MRRVYGPVTSWKQLLDTNMAFLSGQMPRTFYHDGALTSDVLPSVPLLMDLHRWGILTTACRPVCKDVDGQKSYVRALAPLPLALKLLGALLRDKDIYTSTTCFTPSPEDVKAFHEVVKAATVPAPRVVFEDEPHVTLTRVWAANFPSDAPFRMTDERPLDEDDEDGPWIESQYWRGRETEYDGLQHFLRSSGVPHIADLLRDAVEITICSREPASVDAVQQLWGHVQELLKTQNVDDSCACRACLSSPRNIDKLMGGGVQDPEAQKLLAELKSLMAARRRLMDQLSQKVDAERKLVDALTKALEAPGM